MKGLFTVFFVLLLLTGCKTTEYIEVPVEKIKVEYRDKIVKDTVIAKDSVIINNMGDTIFVEKYKLLYKCKEIRDTMSRVDTITVVNTVTKFKEVNRLNGWQKIFIALGGAVTMFGIYKFISFIKA